MKKRNYPATFAAAAFATTATFLPPFAQAAPVAWDAGGGVDTNWNIAPNSLNWSTDANPGSGDDVTFSAAGSGAGTTNTVNQNFTINSLSYTATHGTLINPGTTLSVSGGNVSVSNNANVTLSGATGAFSQTTSGGIFQVGSAATQSSVNMSGLGTFTANLGSTGLFRIGPTNDNTSTGSGSSVTLAATSTITAGTFGVGDEGGVGTTHTLRLGSGVNTINADKVSIGRVTTSSANGRASGSMVFDTGTGSLILRDSAGGSTGTLNMLNTNTNTGNALTSTVNLTGHSANVSVANLNMALRNNTSGGTATSTLSFDAGTLAATTVTMAQRDASSTSTATINIGGGTANFGTINMANANAAAATANATINLTGGTTTVTGNIVKTGGTGTSNASVAIAGGTFVSSGPAKITGANVTLSSGTLDLNLAMTGSLQFNAPTTGSTTGANFLMSGGTLNLSILGLSDFDQMLGGGATAGTFGISGGILDLSGSTLTAGTYDIFSGFNASSAGGNFASITGFDTGAFNVSFASSGGTGTLTVIPEPSTFAMLLGALLVGMRRTRRVTR